MYMYINIIIYMYMTDELCLNIRFGTNKTDQISVKRKYKSRLQKKGESNFEPQPRLHLHRLLLRHHHHPPLDKNIESQPPHTKKINNQDSVEDENI